MGTPRTAFPMFLLFFCLFLLLNWDPVTEAKPQGRSKTKRKKQKLQQKKKKKKRDWGTGTQLDGDNAAEARAAAALDHFNAAQGPGLPMAESVQHYRDALHFQPLFPMATWNLGLMYQQTKSYDQLETLYASVVEENAQHFSPSELPPSLLAEASASASFAPGLAARLAAEPSAVTTAHQLSSGTVSMAQVPYRAGILFYLAQLRGAVLSAGQHTVHQKEVEVSVPTPPLPLTDCITPLHCSVSAIDKNPF